MTCFVALNYQKLHFAHNRKFTHSYILKGPCAVQDSMKLRERPIRRGARLYSTGGSVSSESSL